MLSAGLQEGLKSSRSFRRVFLSILTADRVNLLTR
nr:MAG TPA: hypothetical protein [Caudoviricetes sp.]